MKHEHTQRMGIAPRDSVLTIHPGMNRRKRPRAEQGAMNHHYRIAVTKDDQLSTPPYASHNCVVDIMERAKESKLEEAQGVS